MKKTIVLAIFTLQGNGAERFALTLAKENVNLIVQGRNLEKLKNLEHQFEKIQSIKSNQPKNSITLLSASVPYPFPQYFEP